MTGDASDHQSVASVRRPCTCSLGTEMSAGPELYRLTLYQLSPYTSPGCLYYTMQPCNIETGFGPTTWTLSAPPPADERSLCCPRQQEITAPHFWHNSDKYRALTPAALTVHLATICAQQQSVALQFYIRSDDHFYCHGDISKQSLQGLYKSCMSLEYLQFCL